jgi:hypothetical protein
MKKKIIKWKEVRGIHCLDIPSIFGDYLYIDITRGDGYWQYELAGKCMGGLKTNGRKFRNLEVCKRYTLNQVMKEMKKFNKSLLEISKLLGKGKI